MTGQNIIGNQLSKKGEITFQTVNPQTNKPNKIEFHEATEEELLQAVNLANTAFNTYSQLPGNVRSKFLKEIAKNILELGDDLLTMYCTESGLNKKRAISERTRTLWQIELFIEYLEKGNWVNAIINLANPHRKPYSKPDLRKMLFPLGTVVVFGSSNFPLAYSTAGGDTISALAAGCSVIVKSHPMHAGTGALVALAIQKAAITTQMPDGVFSNLNSNSFKVGTELVKHPEVKAIGFTGSIAGGRAIFGLANKRPEPIPVFAEMGSVNPVILFSEALKDNAAKIAQDFANSITLDSGQFCTNPGLMIGINSPELDHFIALLANEIVDRKPQCMLHPKILDNFKSNKKLVCKSEDVNLSNCTETDIPSNYGRQAIATATGQTFLANKTLHNEVFGPFSLIIKCQDEYELLKVINQLEGQLTGTIIANTIELDSAKNIISHLKNKVGRLIFNGVPTGVEVCHAMHHGGPYPATSNSHFTAVGHDAITRWTRPVSFQNWPDKLLPKELQNENPLAILRNIDGEWSTKKCQ